MSCVSVTEIVKYIHTLFSYRKISLQTCPDLQMCVLMNVCIDGSRDKAVSSTVC